MRSIVWSLLVFFLLFPVHAAQDEMFITIGSFTTHDRANAYSLVVKKAMEQDPDIVTLRISNGFGYGTQVFGDKHRSVIGPFRDLAVLKKVMTVAKTHAADAFVSRYDPAKDLSKMTATQTESNTLVYTIIGIVLLLFFWFVYRTR